MIAKGATQWIAIPLIIGMLSTGASVVLQAYEVYILANVFFLASIVIIILFRDPPRNIGSGVVSPADGKVRRVDRMANSITISTSLLKVHVNRAPMEGKVLKISRGEHYESGRARGQLVTTIASRFGVVRIDQTNRGIASEAMSYVRIGSRLRKGQRIGIVFPRGDVAVILPDTVNITVNVDQRVSAGETKIGAVISKHSKLF